MKTIPSLFVRSTLPALVAAAFLAPSLKADTYRWDADGNPLEGTPPATTPGSGTWSTSAALWNPFLSQLTDVVWDNAGGHVAQFGAAAAADGTYAITVDSTVTNVARLDFQTSGFTLSSTAPTTVALAGGSGAITLSGGNTATIGSNLTFSTTNSTSTILNSSSAGSGTGTLVIGNGGRISSNTTIGLSQGAAASQVRVQVNTGGSLVADRMLLNSIGADASHLVVDGGTVTLANTTNAGGAIFLGSFSTANVTNRSRITLTSGAITATSASGSNGTLQFGVSGGVQTGSSSQGVFDLDGGILTVAQVRESNPANTDSTFNFNGGVLRVRSGTTANTTFMTGIDVANVQAGGAKIDTNGVATTLGQALLAASVNGGLEKQGAGNLTLGGVSTYTGATTVTTGTLILDATGTVNNSSKVIVNSGASFNIAAKASGYTVNGLEGAGAVSLDKNWYPVPL